MKNTKLRYYLRGLGIGVLVTVLILSIANRNEGTMTDAQVRERALELGMVEAGSIMLSDLQNKDTDASDSDLQEEVVEESESAEVLEEATEESVEENTEEATEESVEENIEEATEESVEENTEEATEESVEESIEEATEEASEDIPEEFVFEIKSGSSSYTVSKDLAELGLVEDAKDFDTYLCNNGYSKSIRVGTFTIPAGTNEEEIAKIITGKR